MNKQHLQKLCFINLYCGVIFFIVFPVHYNNYSYSKHDEYKQKEHSQHYIICEVSGSHSGEYENDNFVGYSPNDGGSKHL
jgi:hypothetical protein